jgi:hypothetical protein
MLTLKVLDVMSRSAARSELGRTQIDAVARRRSAHQYCEHRQIERDIAQPEMSRGDLYR